MFSRAFSVILLIVATLAAPVSRAQLAEDSPLRASVEQSVERGLRYLADTQLPNGAYHGDSGSTALFADKGSQLGISHRFATLDEFDDHGHVVGIVFRIDRTKEDRGSRCQGA